MKKGVKVALNILGAIGVGSGGYFIGYKVAKKEASEWASNEINAVINSYEQKESEREEIVAEKLVKPEDLAPELLEQMEYGKADEVIIEPEENDIPFDDPVEVELKEVKPEPKPKKKSKRKTPYFISSEEFDAEAADTGDVIDLEVDENGDLYVDQSEDIYEEWTRLGTTMINKMVREHDIDGVKEWFVRDDQADVFYSITYRK
ncbi:MAG: hypothetical protein J5617_03695 [Bacilli bacterium]|nr:hypothetical protein [Bacilli bacterium]